MNDRGPPFERQRVPVTWKRRLPAAFLPCQNQPAVPRLDISSESSTHNTLVPHHEGQKSNVSPVVQRHRDRCAGARINIVPWHPFATSWRGSEVWQRHEKPIVSKPSRPHRVAAVSPAAVPHTIAHLPKPAGEGRPADGGGTVCRGSVVGLVP